MNTPNPWELGHNLAFPQHDDWSTVGLSHREYLTAHVAAAIVAGCQFDPEQVARRTAAIVDAILLHDLERKRAARLAAKAEDDAERAAAEEARIVAAERAEGGGS